MKIRLPKKLLGILSGLGASLYLTSMAFAQNGAQFDLCPTTTDGRPWANLCKLTGGNAISGLVTLILVIAVIIALFYLLWGGIKWITSGGDKGAVETARNHIIAAIIGLIVVFLAWFILNFLLQTFFGSGGDVRTPLTAPQINVGGGTDDPRCGQKDRGVCNEKFFDNGGCDSGLTSDTSSVCRE